MAMQKNSYRKKNSQPNPEDLPSNDYKLLKVEFDWICLKTNQ